ncbi:MAG: hypothetical protein IH830_14510 [Planctomycetes bacterium]|nr:hypothetical protein [Planctomycetota bacterium]
MNGLLVALIAVASSLGGVVVGVWVALIWHNRRSAWYRHRHDIPDIVGKWRCEWFDGDAKTEPRVQDTLEITGWTREGEFTARGHQPQHHLVYPLVGEIDPSRVVTLTYRAARYPYEPNRGVVCMQLSRDGQRMEGQWFGRRYSGELSGGRVTCDRMTSTTPAQ